MAPMTSTTGTVGSGTAALTYDVHGDLATVTPEQPALFMLGSPMAAEGFDSLRAHFGDRVVVTYDPRGSGRNPVDTTPIPPEEHAADLHAVIAALGVGPVDVFATSGGAVNVLALIAAHPDDVRRVVAHEPPTAAFFPDREPAIAVCEDIRATYDASGSGPAMAKFISVVMFEGELTADYLARAAPDPAMFGLPADDDGSRTDPLMRNMPSLNTYSPDLTALAAIGDRLVIAAGVESGETFAARGARTVAAALGVDAVEFPSHHGGFLGGEFGQQGDPDAFGPRLREVLGY